VTIHATCLSASRHIHITGRHQCLERGIIDYEPSIGAVQSTRRLALVVALDRYDDGDLRRLAAPAADVAALTFPAL
jgi:hypothetical protein